MNHIFLTGMVTRINFRETYEQQIPLCEFDLEFQVERGELSETQTVTVTAWNDLAKSVYEKVAEGDAIAVEGLLQIEQIPQGEDRPLSKVNVRAVRVQPSLPEQSFNIVTLIGYVGGEPNRRELESGSVVTNLTIAINRYNSEDPDWYTLETWNKTAEVAASYVRKGGLLGIRGALRIDHWTDRETQGQRSRPVVRVDQLDLLGGKREAESAVPSEPVAEAEKPSSPVVQQKKRNPRKKADPISA